VLKTCSSCNLSQNINNFYKAKGYKDGHQGQCKKCLAAKNALWGKNNPEVKALKQRRWATKNPAKAKELKDNWYSKNLAKRAELKAQYRASKLQRTPIWFEADKVAMVYAKAKEWHMDVDHVIPLQGKLVSGLHCWANLQLLNKALNSSKGNRYEY
jgi:hypothetical protein